MIRWGSLFRRRRTGWRMRQFHIVGSRNRLRLAGRRWNNDSGLTADIALILTSNSERQSDRFQHCFLSSYLIFVFSNSWTMCRLMNGFWRIFFAVGRVSGSLLSMDLIIAVNGSLYFFEVWGIWNDHRWSIDRLNEKKRTWPRMIFSTSEFISLALNACSNVVIS